LGCCGTAADGTRPCGGTAGHTTGGGHGGRWGSDEIGAGGVGGFGFEQGLEKVFFEQGTVGFREKGGGGGGQAVKLVEGFEDGLLAGDAVGAEVGEQAHGFVAGVDFALLVDFEDGGAAFEEKDGDFAELAQDA